MSTLRALLPSRAMAVALVALFLNVTGIAYAATGGNLILGQPNTATTQTGLTANFAGRTLQLTNTNASAGASPLGLTTATGRPPFFTNSSTKVGNLNADQLDGLDSGSFVQGFGGRMMYLRRTLTLGQTTVAFTFPGFFQLEIECDLSSGNPPPVATYTFRNLSTAYPLDFMGSDSPDFPITIAPGEFRGTGVSNGLFTTYQVGQSYSLVPGGPPTRTRIATLALTQRGGSPCFFQGQALVQG